LGSITPHVVAAYAGCDALVLEFNHDPALLEGSVYPTSLKRRISSAYGHLSNVQSLDLLARLDTSRLQCLVAAHLSEKTNRPGLVADCLAAQLPAVPATIAPQEGVVPWFDVKAA